MKCLKYFVYVLFLFSFLPVAQADILNGFQGVRWGSTESQLLKKFPNSIKLTAGCGSETSRTFTKILKVKCFEYVIYGYVVGDYTFNVSFQFDINDKGLKSASLTPSFKLNQEMVVKSHLSTEVYRFLKQTLTDKYGHPASEVLNLQKSPREVFWEDAHWKQDKTEITLNGRVILNEELTDDNKLEVIFLQYKIIDTQSIDAL